MFTERHSASLAEQEAGICAFYVLVAGDRAVLGRFNLYDFEDGKVASIRSEGPARRHVPRLTSDLAAAAG